MQLSPEGNKKATRKSSGFTQINNAYQLTDEPSSTFPSGLMK